MGWHSHQPLLYRQLIALTCWWVLQQTRNFYLWPNRVGEHLWKRNPPQEAVTKGPIRIVWQNIHRLTHSCFYGIWIWSFVHNQHLHFLMENTFDLFFFFNVATADLTDFTLSTKATNAIDLPCFLLRTTHPAIALLHLAHWPSASNIATAEVLFCKPSVIPVTAEALTALGAYFRGAIHLLAIFKAVDENLQLIAQCFSTIFVFVWARLIGGSIGLFCYAFQKKSWSWSEFCHIRPMGPIPHWGLYLTWTYGCTACTWAATWK